jgi:hypothetical protein
MGTVRGGVRKRVKLGATIAIFSHFTLNVQGHWALSTLCRQPPMCVLNCPLSKETSTDAILPTIPSILTTEVMAMSSRIPTTPLGHLRRAFRDGRLTLFLGAGCSVESGIPTWPQLVTTLYMNGVSRRLRRYSRIREFVPSVTQWAFERNVVPLEVAARGLNTYFLTDADFVNMIQIALYNPTGFYGFDRRPREIRKLLAKNKTLNGIAQLCRHTILGKRGVQSVVTYNYDDLLERMLDPSRCSPVWKGIPLRSNKLPIYHVHGFIPFGERSGSRLDEIVLSEDQYHRAAQDPYSWSNLVQMQALSESVGLMIGLSLTDWNLRRILDNVRSLPRRSQSYALLKRIGPWKVDDKDIDAIVETMKRRIPMFYRLDAQNAMAAIERPAIRKLIRNAIRRLSTLDLKREELVLADLGVTVIWYDHHDDIVEMLKSVSTASHR